MDFDPQAFEEDADAEQSAPPEEASNRNFLIIAGVLGGVVLLAIICVVVLVLRYSGQRAQQNLQVATLTAQSLEVAQIVNQTASAATETAIVVAWTPTPTKTPIPPSPTPQPSPTAVLAIATTQSAPTITPQPDMATATALHATLTRNAVLFAGTATARAVSATQGIPDTGFADNFGLPALLGMAVLLVVVIFLARRLRTT